MNTKEQGSGTNSRLIFITGGARSGKSAFALEMANQAGRSAGSPQINRKCYLATAQAFDSEMDERIARHKAERGEDWDCIEEPLKVTEKIEEVKGRYDVILFDCLTLWVSNLMLKEQKSEVEDLIATFKSSESTIIVVSNEVGLGIVPENALARRFRDLAGTANQLIAKAADEAYFVVSGIPMKLK